MSLQKRYIPGTNLAMFISSLWLCKIWKLFAVSVKWQKEVFPAVEIDTSQSPYLFKCQLYDLTGVPPERQKIMVKGGLLKVLNYSSYLVCLNLSSLKNDTNFIILEHYGIYWTDLKWLLIVLAFLSVNIGWRRLVKIRGKGGNSFITLSLHFSF